MESNMLFPLKKSLIKNGKIITKTCASTGEFRKPLKGEYFLSGSIIEGYRAPINFQTMKYNIARPVKVVTYTHFEEI